VSQPSLEVEVQGPIGPLSIALAIRAGASPTVVVGPNGAGKTSALMMILGVIRPHRGRVVLDGVSLFDGERRIDLPIEGRRIGFLPQRPALFPHLDVLGNVAYGLWELPKGERTRRAMAVLAGLGVGALAARRPSDLSGGEAQRVALARALAPQPRALLLDEPLAALDAGVRRDARRLLADTLRTLAIPAVIVTHDRGDAEAFGGEMVVLEGGAMVQRGPLADLAARPATAFVRQFVG
jgi:molybdate transport system ATP-binding protein